MVGAPGVADALNIDRGLVLMATLLSAPMALSLVLEPWFRALSDRVDCGRWCGALWPGPRPA